MFSQLELLLLTSCLVSTVTYLTLPYFVPILLSLSILSSCARFRDKKLKTYSQPGSFKKMSDIAQDNDERL